MSKSFNGFYCLKYFMRTLLTISLIDLMTQTYKSKRKFRYNLK